MALMLRQWLTEGMREGAFPGTQACLSLPGQAGGRGNQHSQDSQHFSLRGGLPHHSPHSINSSTPLCEGETASHLLKGGKETDNHKTPKYTASQGYFTQGCLPGPVFSMAHSHCPGQYFHQEKGLRGPLALVSPGPATLP